MIWLINIKAQGSGNFGGWNDEKFSPLLFLFWHYLIPYVSHWGTPAIWTWLFCLIFFFITSTYEYFFYASISSSINLHKSYFQLYFVNSVYLVIILRWWSKLWLTAGNNYSYIKCLLIYPKFLNFTPSEQTYKATDFFPFAWPFLKAGFPKRNPIRKNIWVVGRPIFWRLSDFSSVGSHKS